MYPFIETIKVQQGKPQALAFHQSRFDDTRRDFYGPEIKPINLQQLFSYPKLKIDLVYKWRILYGQEIGQISLVPYKPKSISSLELVIADDLDYTYKFSDRGRLNALYNSSGSDDIIIVKNGFITDSYYANLVFQNEHGFFTSKTPLLSGTRRRRLLSENRIVEDDIRVDDLEQFDAVHLINAMLDIGDASVPVESIIKKI